MCMRYIVTSALLSVQLITEQGLIPCNSQCTTVLCVRAPPLVVSTISTIKCVVSVGACGVHDGLWGPSHDIGHPRKILHITL